MGVESPLFVANIAGGGPQFVVGDRNSVAHEHALAYQVILRRVLKLERGDPAPTS
jgi:hypothetical protein